MINSYIFEEQKTLYSNSYRQFAGSPKATMQVHSDYQTLRFRKILNQIDFTKQVSMLDYACGQGDLFEYINSQNFPISYSGIDINEDYINFAKNKFSSFANNFELQYTGLPVLTQNYDYICISGMFHFKGSANASEWESMCKTILDLLFKKVNKALIFNCLTSHVDFMEDNLFYWDPTIVSNHVQNSLSRHFNLDHSYPLYEWTMAVYTSEFIQTKFSQKTFEKYF